MITKTCTRCNQNKPLSEFYFHRSGKYNGTPASHCRDCRRDYLREWRHTTGVSVPLKAAKESGSYLGIYIAERVLSGIFDHMERMPYGFPGYDFICGKGFKIDAKSACLRNVSSCGRTYHRWDFHIFKNRIADYFLCLAFDNRDNLEPQHVWLIPSRILKNKGEFQIYDTTRNLNTWSEYERSLDRTMECCQKMRAAGVS